MSLTQAQLKSLMVSLGSEDAPQLAIYPDNQYGGNIDDAILTGELRKSPNGKKQYELSIGVVLYDRVAVAFPIIDVLKFALQQHPELLQRAQAELTQEASA